MVNLCGSFFTPDIIRSIRVSKRGFDTKIWYMYREYHSQHQERVNPKNAIFVYHEFQNICETIAGFTNDSHVRTYLLRKFY